MPSKPSLSDQANTTFPRSIYLLFFLSGASSLMFETLWQRMMVLVFGASAIATTGIFTAFFCGIAFGSWWGGKLLGKFKNPLLFYAWVEIWIGFWGLLVPFLLKGADHFYLSIYFDSEPGLLPRFLLSIAVVLPATLGMGATVPLMNRILSDFGKGVGQSVGKAYGANTLGAVSGTLICGFVLIRLLGVQNTLYVASSINLLVVLGSFGLSKKIASPPTPKPEPFSPLSKTGRGLLILYFLAGFLALAFEILWFRLLGMYGTYSITTFTMVLSIYLFGFSLGSLVLYPKLSKSMSPSSVFVLSLWGCGVFSLWGLWVCYQIPDLTQTFILEPFQRGALTMSHILTKEFLSGFLMMFPATLFMGLTYPALCQMLIGDSKAMGAQSGRFYFWGTLGSMSGAMLTGLYLLPMLGLVWSYALFMTLYFCAALLSLALTTKPSRSFLVFITTTGVLLAALAVGYGFTGHPFYAHGSLKKGNDGVWYVYDEALEKNRSSASPTNQVAFQNRVLRAYQVGQSGTVTVEEKQYGTSPDQIKRINRIINVDGQAVASSQGGAVVDSKMLAHLPLLLHPDPKNALTVGFGSGGTSWSMTCHDIETYCVEIEPQVPACAKFFEDLQNYGVIRHPKFHLILNDARDHLHITGRKYDVISTDVTNLQYKQNGNLYTVEYFQLMEDKLSEQGIACAWVPMAAISVEEFKILLKSFQAVFPHTSLWYLNHTQTNFGIFIGTPSPLKIDMARLEEGFSNPKIKEDLIKINMTHPFQWIQALLLDEEGVRKHVGAVSLHTDDHPILEFASPLSYYNKAPLFLQNLEETLKLRPKNLEVYLQGFDPSQKPLFDRYSQVSTLLNKMMINLYQIHINMMRQNNEKLQSSDPQVLQKAAQTILKAATEGLRLGQEAEALIPGIPQVQHNVKVFRSVMD